MNTNNSKEVEEVTMYRCRQCRRVHTDPLLATHCFNTHTFGLMELEEIVKSHRKGHSIGDKFMFWHRRIKELKNYIDNVVHTEENGRRARVLMGESKEKARILFER